MNIVEVCNKLVQKDRDVNAACIEAGMIPFLNRCLAEAVCGPFGSGKKDLLLFAVKALAKLAAGPPHHTAVSMYEWMDGWMCIHIVCMRVMFCSRTCSRPLYRFQALVHGSTLPIVMKVFVVKHCISPAFAKEAFWISKGHSLCRHSPCPA